MTRRCKLLAAVLTTLLLPPALHAQQVVVRGHVLGPDDAPLPDHRVVLHRVDAAGGATIGEAMSDANGSFELLAEPSADTAAVYFVASRYEGELYIGDMFRPVAGVTEQTIQVGVAATSAAALMEAQLPAPQPARPEPSRNWLLLVIPLIGVIGAAVYALLPRSRIAPERALLIRVAELDERLETAPPAQRESLLVRRRELISQLRTD